MRKFLALAIAVFVISGCSKVSDQDIERAIENNPDLIVKVIENNAEKVFTALNKVASEQREKAQKQAALDKEKEREKEFDNPKKPVLQADYNYRGPENAPITIVEYSDFQCPFCERGYSTLMEIMKEYDGKVRFTYKHLPLINIHPQALPSAQYYEAIAIQDKEKAWKFHDELFNNQANMSKGESYFKEVAQKLGVDMNKLAKDVKSEQVKNKIDKDMQEAQSFGFNGTPAFLINGVSLVGAQPKAEFVKVIDKHLDKLAKS